jgi:hypothetical protein
VEAVKCEVRSANDEEVRSESAGVQATKSSGFDFVKVGFLRFELLTSKPTVRHSHFELRPSHFDTPLTKRYRAQGKSGHSAFDLVRGRNVTELVASVASKLFEAVKLTDVNALLLGVALIEFRLLVFPERLCSVTNGSSQLRRRLMTSTRNAPRE